MIAENNIVLEQAVANVSQLTEDKRIQDEIWKREDNARIERTNKNAYERAVVQLREKDALIEEKDTLIEEKDALIEEKDALIEEKDALIEEKDALIEEKDALIEELKAEIELLIKSGKQ